jgi:ATP-binding cassette subfamily F protein 3
VLLLDEPTNHLDVDMRNSLLIALQEFAGAVVVVSHDRTLLRGICDRFVLVANGKVDEFDGDLDDYARWLAADSRRETATAVDAGRANAANAAERRDARRREAEARNRLSPLRAELKRVESRLPALSARRNELERQIADPAFYQNMSPEQRQSLLAEHVAVLADIDSQETRWLELSEELTAS